VSFAATGSREREVLKMKFLSSLGISIAQHCSER
jgi:hypothetical protein